MKLDINFPDPKTLSYEEHVENMRQHFTNVITYGIRHLSHYRSSTGLAGIEYINNKLKPNSVLDVGCGMNKFKELLPNLTGVDLVDYRACDKYGNATGADWFGDVMDFNQPHDMIYCVGALNFGSEATILKLLDKFKTLSKTGRVFGHVRPGQKEDINRDKQAGFLHYPWTMAEVERITDLAGYEIVNLKVESTSVTDMPDDIITLYKSFFDTKMKETDYEKIHESDNDKCIDPNIPYHSKSYIHKVVQNEYCRRFEKESYNSNIEITGVRNRLHVEIQRKS